MSHMEDEHLDVSTCSKIGGFVVQLEENPFRKISAAQAWEDTINKGHTNSWKHQ